MAKVINEDDDKCVWTASSNGSFSLKSAWEEIRRKKNVIGSSKFIWHPCVPLKWSIITWRSLLKSLPLDDCITKRGFQLAFKCNCCLSPQVETVDHVFANSDTAEEVWNYFKAMIGIQSYSSSL